MKKGLAIVLALVMMVVFLGCDNGLNPQLPSNPVGVLQKH